jgi:sensor histidine kinase YesM
MSINARACVDGLLGGHAFAGGTLFIGRRFLSALPMLILVTMADNATARSSTPARVGAFCGAVVLGAVVYALAFHYTQPAGWIAKDGTFSDGTIFLVMQFFQALPYGGLAAALLFYFAHEQRHASALKDSSLAKLTLDRQTIEARLQALQAQIEPHFLFNTLANVRLLYEGDACRAKSLVHDLADYLRAALPRMRETGSTLGREMSLVQAYLRILKVRMGERLNVLIDVPADLRSASLPPMMLTTLVENAIKHGLNPSPEGGTIAVHAKRCGTALRIVVSDDGVGFQQARGTGIGLANTRARLASLYGGAGRLTLEANPRGGVSATIELPCGAPDVVAIAL